MYASRHRRRPAPLALPGSRGAFTLVELVVVIVILAILASLTLSGLNGARQRAKIDKTRSTIRKLHEIVMPIYESYVERRITPGYDPSTGSPIANSKTKVAQIQLYAKRFIMATDLPDLWDDAWSQSGASYSVFPSTANFQSPNPRYQAIGDSRFVSGFDPVKAMAFESAECLQMIVVRGGFSPDAVEQFRSDEIGDVDGDGLPEFVDGWGRPISFIRWPAGFESVIQMTTALDGPDPLDPLGVSKNMSNPTTGGASCTDRALTPLIYSGGPNNALDATIDGSSGSYGLVSSREALGGGIWQKSGWINPASTAKYEFTTTRWQASGSFCAGWKKIQREAADNITNHDLVTK